MNTSPFSFAKALSCTDVTDSEKNVNSAILDLRRLQQQCCMKDYTICNSTDSSSSVFESHLGFEPTGT